MAMDGLHVVLAHRCQYGMKDPRTGSSGPVAKSAAIFPLALCKDIIRGMTNQIEADGKKQRDEVGVNGVWQDLVMPISSEEAEAQHDATGTASQA